jgi:hypothetical protein
MNLKSIALFIGMSLLFAGCSSPTPGDAAYRGKHYEQAANLYRKGAELGDKTAALKLGLMLFENQINTSDYGNAVKWFIKACELGSNEGCHNSGNAYEYGKMGASKNYTIAQKYYTIAAKKGFIQSQYNLGTLYSNQYLNDDVEGLKWIFIAKNSAKNCSSEPLCQWITKDPPNHQGKLENRMNEKEIQKAKKQANEWINKH